jgi:IclR family pca regulon transcriptional regulator
LHDETEGRDSGLFVASVGKAFRVLSLFSDSRVELGLSEIATLSGLGKSASQRFLYTLHTLGYLNRNPVSKNYRLSSKLLAVSGSYSPTSLLTERAEGLLLEGNLRCKETVNLTVLDDTDVVYILRFPSKHVVSVNLSVGTKLPAFCTAPGRVLLAHADHRQQEDVLARSELKKWTAYTETDPQRLLQILRQVLQRGYATANQETFVGDISTAAPVFDDRGRAVAAVNIAVPYPRWSLKEAQRRLTPAVREIALSVSKALGWKQA